MKRDNTNPQPGRKVGFGVRLVRALSGVIDLCVLILLLLCLFIGFYALWDTHQLYQQADAKQYEVYKPTVEDNRSFTDFQTLNDEVIGWLTVYGTEIDYPLVQAEDNSKYLTLAADLTYSASGSLFLDYRSQKDFSDFNSIVYGHHMAGDAMFGDLDLFLEESFFRSHQYGYLYAADGTAYGLDFFAVLDADAYDFQLYTPAVVGEEAQAAYLEHLLSLARYTRVDRSVTAEDRIVLLSTCAEVTTNGRTVLVGRLTEQVAQNPWQEEEDTASGTPAGADLYSFFAQWERVPMLVWALLVLLVLIGILVIYNAALKRRRGKREGQLSPKEQGKPKRLKDTQDE